MKSNFNPFVSTNAATSSSHASAQAFGRPRREDGPSTSSSRVALQQQQMAAGKSTAAKLQSTLRYAQTSPVTQLKSQKEVNKAFADFRKHLARWEPRWNEIVADPDAFGSDSNNPTPQQAWNTKLSNTHMILTSLMDGGHASDENTGIFAYRMNDKPIGLMALKNLPDDPEFPNLPSLAPSVEAIVVDPGTAGAGGALIEHAVNASVNFGKEGKLRLHAENPDAEKAYLAMGFVKVGRDMELDPVGSDKWTNEKGPWQLAKHVDQKYLAGIGQPKGSVGFLKKLASAFS